MVNYKSIRIINGKPKKVIVDENGDIINNNPGKDRILKIEGDIRYCE